MVPGHEILINAHFRGSKSRRCNKFKGRTANEFSRQPEERLFKVVVGLCGNVVVLEVLFSVKGDDLCLDLALLIVDLVAAKNYRYALTNTEEITMPIGNVLVGDARGDVKHDDSKVTIDVVAVTETAKLFLPSSIPDLKLNCTVVGGEV